MNLSSEIVKFARALFLILQHSCDPPPAMLTESFIVSTLNAEKPSNNISLGVHLYDFQPLPALKSTFKKSSTNTNSLAVSPTHVFAAQEDKAVIHVYSRERNSQEAVVPFPEKIRSLVLAGESYGAGTLILGTEGGRVILWEVCHTAGTISSRNADNLK